MIEVVMPILLLIILVFIYTGQSLFTKLYTDKYPGDEDVASSVLTIVSGFFTAFITFSCFEFFRFTFNPWSMLIGALNAVALFGYNYFIVKASQTGPYSVLMMFSMSAGIIMPIIVSLIMGWDSSWNEPYKIVLNSVCIAAIIVSVYLVSNKKTTAEKDSVAVQKPSLKFLLACVGLAICNGSYGIFLIAQQNIVQAGGNSNRGEMVIVTFFFAAVISLVQGFIKKKKRFLSSFKQNKQSLLFLILTSIVFSLGVNVLVVIITLGVDTTILYTFDNASVLILSVVASRIFFKEKISKMNAVGCAIACTAIVVMNLIPAIIESSAV